jgi:hypothetical protein
MKEPEILISCWIWQKLQRIFGQKYNANKALHADTQRPAPFVCSASLHFNTKAAPLWVRVSAALGVFSVRRFAVPHRRTWRIFMFKKMIVVLSLGFVVIAAYAGSCTDCKTTYDEHKAACRGDTTCETRALEAYESCKIGC